jgi:transcriptional regulator with XRE-family HTH domain
MRSADKDMRRRLRRFRKAMGFDRKGFAVSFGVSEAVVVQLEAGTRGLLKDSDVAKSIERVWGHGPLRWILTGDKACLDHTKIAALEQVEWTDKAS